MPNHVLSLNELAQKIYQGITLNRYQDSEGSQERVINVRNLEQLYVANDLNMVKLNTFNLDQYRLRTNDVVIAIRGTPLKASVVTKELEGSLVGQNLAVLRPTAQINSVYLAVVMRSQWLEQQLATLYSQSTGTQVLKISQLRELKIPLPNLDTQNKLAQLFIATERYTQITLKALETRTRLSELALFQILEGQ